MKKRKNMLKSFREVYVLTGRIVKGLGGLYEVRLASGERINCTARGIFRHAGLTPLVGDFADINNDNGSEGVITEIVNRKNFLIRPPLANLDYLFCFVSCAKPAPVFETVDKLTAIAEHNGVEPVIVVSKLDLGGESEKIQTVYKKCGYTVFGVSVKTGDGIDSLREYLKDTVGEGTAAFAGASGVGKSTLMNSLFPALSLETGGLSRKTERGRHTTRHAELYFAGEHADSALDCVIADTPGFSMLDFVHFDFFDKEDLPHNFREFAPYISECRYRDCTHTGEEGCAVLSAVEKGDIPKSRYDSFSQIYKDIKDKRPWNVKN